MAVRRPLVRINGRNTELPLSDSLPGFSGAITSGEKQLIYANGLLSSVTDTSGKAVALAYANGRLATVTATGTGQTVTKTLAYTAGGALDKVTQVVT